MDKNSGRSWLKLRKPRLSRETKRQPKLCARSIPIVVAAYPITPQTEIVQLFSTFVSDGLVKTEFVAVESEHSAMSATVGAAAAGTQAMTATSSQGLAFMWEMFYA